MLSFGFQWNTWQDSRRQINKSAPSVVFLGIHCAKYCIHCRESYNCVIYLMWNIVGMYCILILGGLSSCSLHMCSYQIDSMYGIQNKSLLLMPFLLLLFARGNTKVEEACEMYTRAANMFKIAKNWSGMYRGVSFPCRRRGQIFIFASP